MLLPFNTAALIRELNHWIQTPSPEASRPPRKDLPQTTLIPDRPSRGVEGPLSTYRSARRLGSYRDYAPEPAQRTRWPGLHPLLALGLTALLGAVGAVFRVPREGDENPERRDDTLRNIERQILEAQGFPGSLEDLIHAGTIRGDREGERIQALAEGVEDQALRLYEAGEYTDEELRNIRLGEGLGLNPAQVRASLSRAQRYLASPAFREYANALKYWSELEQRLEETYFEAQQHAEDSPERDRLEELHERLDSEYGSWEDRMWSLEELVAGEIPRPAFAPEVPDQAIETFLGVFGSPLTADELRLVAESEFQGTSHAMPASRLLEIVAYAQSRAHSSGRPYQSRSDLRGLSEEQVRRALAHIEAHVQLPAFEEYRSALLDRAAAGQDPEAEPRLTRARELFLRQRNAAVLWPGSPFLDTAAPHNQIYRLPEAGPEEEGSDPIASLSLEALRASEEMGAQMEGRTSRLLGREEILRISCEDLDIELVRRQVFALLPREMQTEIYRQAHVPALAEQVLAGLRAMSRNQLLSLYSTEPEGSVVRGGAPLSYAARVVLEHLASHPEASENFEIFRGEIGSRLERERPRLVSTLLEGLQRARHAGERR